MSCPVLHSSSSSKSTSTPSYSKSGTVTGTNSDSMKSTKSYSNMFVGYDTTMIFKLFFSIKFFLFLGGLLALALPVYAWSALSVIFLLPSFYNSLYYYFTGKSTPNNHHPIIYGRHTSDLSELHSIVDSQGSIPYSLPESEKSDSICVFMVGARFNGPFPSNGYKWVGEAFIEMIRELESNPSLGCLNVEYLASQNPEINQLISLQYWKSSAHVINFARASGSKHSNSWSKLMSLNAIDPRIGYWHELYEIPKSSIESIYINMPTRGLGKIGNLIPAKGIEKTARGRLRKTDGNDWKEINDSIIQKNAENENYY